MKKFCLIIVVAVFVTVISVLNEKKIADEELQKIILFLRFKAKTGKTIHG